ncbi:MAG TPA: hypothetical protein VK762_19645 [Polyangiaceae bacterium]|jgi:hypothetical protein|nr:hypothetical protein [Polyangiaceae bacterium]
MNDLNKEPTTRRSRVKLPLAFAAIAGVSVACVMARPTSTASTPATAAAPTATAARLAAIEAPVVHTEPPPPPPPEPPAIELPRGGRTLFPDYRLVGFCGTPGAPELGSLQGNLTARARALDAQATRYADARNADDRKLMPVFELIAVVVQGAPGPDSKYRRRVDGAVVEQYLRAARASKALLLLNIQPGQSDFLSEVKAYEKYLREPDVGVALDPEWAMRPKQLPGRSFGQTDGQTITAVANYLSGIVAEEKLPEKALVFHQVNNWVLKDEPELKPAPGVIFIKSVDGLGAVASKIKTYDYLTGSMASDVHPGFKLFFDEDTRNGSRLMTPKEVLALSPKPEYVMYE